MATLNKLDIMTVIVLSLTFTAGLALGAFYIFTLWKTVKNLPGSSHPLRLMMASFAMRAAILLIALYFIADGHWERLALAFSGFIIMKIFLTRHLGIDKAA